MGATPPYEPFEAMGIRTTLLNAAGHPIAGANNGYFSRQVVKFMPELDIDKGKRQVLRRGDNQVCATSRTQDVILGSLLDLELCTEDSALIAQLTGSIPYTSGSSQMGFQSLESIDPYPNGCLVELFCRAWDNVLQATPSALGSAPAYFVYVLPWFRGQLQKLTVDGTHNSVPISGWSDPNPHAVLTGPYQDWPTYVSNGGGATRPWCTFLTSTFPSTEGFLTVLAAGS